LEKERKISVSTLLSPEVVDRLDQICREERKSLSGIIREAVEQFVKNKRGERRQ